MSDCSNFNVKKRRALCKSYAVLLNNTWSYTYNNMLYFSEIFFSEIMTACGTFYRDSPSIAKFITYPYFNCNLVRRCTQKSMFDFHIRVSYFVSTCNTRVYARSTRHLCEYLRSLPVRNLNSLLLIRGASCCCVCQHQATSQVLVSDGYSVSYVLSWILTHWHALTSVRRHRMRVEIGYVLDIMFSEYVDYYKSFVTLSNLFEVFFNVM
jgi:hypothetical protein